MTHVITAGSGLDSERECTIIPWSEAQTLARQYPFVGGRTPQGMGWVAVQFDDGTINTFPKRRVVLLQA